MLASGQYQDALGHCRAAVALAESIFQADPSDSAQLAYALVLEGRICLADGRWSDARRIFQRALSLGEAAQRAEPDNLRRKQLLAESNYWLGKTLSKSESSAMALPYYRRSHAMFGDIAVRRPDIAHHVLDFIDASVNLAAACLACRTGDADAEARDLLLVAKSDLRRLLEEGRLVGINDEYERRAQAIEANRRILEAHEPSE
jgi:tetratricopeptide (TPR) repeat protein